MTRKRNITGEFFFARAVLFGVVLYAHKTPFKSELISNLINDTGILHGL